MLRLVVDDEGQIWPDLLQKLPGRGVYLCMGQRCLGRLGDRQLQPLLAKFKVELPQWEQFKKRVEHALEKWLLQTFARLAAKVDVGRDAVMHRLWNNSPLLLFLAADAGDAVVRQVEAAVEKRAQAGYSSLTVQAYSRQWLGSMFGRDSVAVAAIDSSGTMAVSAEKLERFCGWYANLKEI